MGTSGLPTRDRRRVCVYLRQNESPVNPPAVALRHPGGRRIRAARWLIPGAVGACLFIANNLAILHGWMSPPPGYTGLGSFRANDIGLYFVWIEGFRRSSLLPNYTVPWQTEPAFFQPLMWVIGRLANLLGSAGTAYLVCHFVLYLVAAYALAFAIRTFAATRTQRRLAVLFVVCSVPLTSLAIVPRLLLGNADWSQTGMGSFVWITPDGFLRGIAGGILQTFGTGASLLCFATIARFIESGRRRWLALACVLVYTIASVHISEAFLIVVATGITLVISAPGGWRRAYRAAALLSTCAALGVLPYMIQGARHPWLWELSSHARWQLPEPPWIILRALGAPTLLAITLVAARPKMPRGSDLLLQCWAIAALAGVYLPVVPSPRHMLDGVLYATALLLARQVSQVRVLQTPDSCFRGLAKVTVGCWVAVSVLAFPMYYRAAWLNGVNPVNSGITPSTISRVSERESIEWLRHTATAQDLVLAPPESAIWFATIPTHSFGAHWHWSTSYAEQRSLADAFYSGSMGCFEAEEFLRRFGIRYVVMPSESPVKRCLDNASLRAAFASMSIYEFAGHALKPRTDQ